MIKACEQAGCIPVTQRRSLPPPDFSKGSSNCKSCRQQAPRAGAMVCEIEDSRALMYAIELRDRMLEGGILRGVVQEFELQTHALGLKDPMGLARFEKQFASSDLDWPCNFLSVKRSRR